MGRPLFTILTGLALGAVAIRYCAKWYSFQKGDVINCFGFLLLLTSAVLVYFQIKSTLAFNRRQTTHNFIYGPITLTLLPLEKELKRLLNRTTLVFETGEIIDLHAESDVQTQIRSVLMDILNFYERMAIALQSSVLDEDMMYDDKGAVFLRIHDWAHPFITHLQNLHDQRAYANVQVIAHIWRKKYDKAVNHRHKLQEKHSAAVALRKRDFFS